MTIMTQGMVESEGVCNRKSVFYNRQMDSEFDVEVPVLNGKHGILIRELLASENVGVYEDGAVSYVEITSVEAELSNEDSAVDVVKFSFKYADRRPRIQYLSGAASGGSDSGWVPDGDGRIFSEVFNSVFA